MNPELSLNIEIIEEIGWDELATQLGAVTLLGQPNKLPYADADITLEWVTYDTSPNTDIQPTSLYVASDLLHRQAKIAATIGEQGYHPLEFGGSESPNTAAGVVLASTDKMGVETIHRLTPPIVEVSTSGERILCDGSHRVNRGRWGEGRLGFLAVVVSGVETPFYALPNTWDEVTVYPIAPKDPTLRKRYRELDAVKRNALYRDLGPVNGSAPRYAN